MSTDRGSRDWSAKAAEAEEAVKSVKDPELRRVAFEKILAHLLGNAEGAPASDSTSKQKPAAPKARRASGLGKRAPSVKAGPKARVEELVDGGYFKKQRTIADVKTELANRGHHIPLTSLSGPLQALTQERRLRRQKVATNGKGSKVTYAYSNW